MRYSAPAGRSALQRKEYNKMILKKTIKKKRNENIYKRNENRMKRNKIIIKDPRSRQRLLWCEIMRMGVDETRVTVVTADILLKLI